MLMFVYFMGLVVLQDFLMLQDSLVDLVAGLGVPLDQLILGVPTMASLFTLQNATLTTPRSPALQPPTFIPYPQVRLAAANMWLVLQVCQAVYSVWCYRCTMYGWCYRCVK